MSGFLSFDAKFDGMARCCVRLQVLLGDALFREREHRRAIVRVALIECVLGLDC